MLKRPLTKKSAKLFKNYYTNKKFRLKYKYITIITMNKNDIDAYMSFFKECERMDLKYFFLISERENVYRFYGFSTFMVPEWFESYCSDITRLNNDFLILFYIDRWMEEADSFIASAYEPRDYKILKRFKL